MKKDVFTNKIERNLLTWGSRSISRGDSLEEALSGTQYTV